MSALPTFLKTWDFQASLPKVNVSIPYVSLNDVMATFLYGIKNHAVTDLGATVWGSCDGTTGDATDRWASKANVTTRGATTGNANSWIVIVYAGVQWLISYVGATDDLATIAYSPGSLYVLAGTPTFTPTATDQCVISTGVTIIDPTTSAARVYHVLGTTDRTVMRIFLHRAGVLIRSLFLERITEGPNIASGFVFGGNSTIAATVVTSNTTGVQSGTWGGGAGATNSAVGFVAGAPRAVNGGCMTSNGVVANTLSNPTEVNGAEPIFPLTLWCNTASMNAWLGTRFDAFSALAGANVTGATLDDLGTATRIALLGGMFFSPWPNTVGVQTA